MELSSFQKKHVTEEGLAQSPGALPVPAGSSRKSHAAPQSELAARPFPFTLGETRLDSSKLFQSHPSNLGNGTLPGLPFPGCVNQHLGVLLHFLIISVLVGPCVARISVPLRFVGNVGCAGDSADGLSLLTRALN